MKSIKKWKKALLAAAAAVCGVLLLYALFCLVATPLFYNVYASAAEELHTIPDLWNDFTPQGVTKQEGGDSYMICGYMPGSEPSRIYRIDADGSKTLIRLAKMDGSAYTGHAGGLTASGGFVYISNASQLFVLSADDIANAKDGDTVAFIGSFTVPCRASFCSSDGKMLYVGEYHAEGYDTDESHILSMRDGETYAAMVFAYRLDDAAEFGVTEPYAPVAAYAIRDKAQGFAIDPDGTAYISCSWGLESAALYRYTTDGDADSVFQYADTQIPLYMLDAQRQINVTTMPHMSEDLEYREGVLLMAFEAGAKKYGAGLLPFSVRSIVALHPDQLS